MGNYREKIGVQVAATVKIWMEFMTRERLRWASFNLGPAPSDDERSAEVGLMLELLEDKGYKVQLTTNVVQLMQAPSANGPVTLPICVFTFVLRAPEIQRVTLG